MLTNPYETQVVSHRSGVKIGESVSVHPAMAAAATEGDRLPSARSPATVRDDDEAGGDVPAVPGLPWTEEASRTAREHPGVRAPDGPDRDREVRQGQRLRQRHDEEVLDEAKDFFGM